MKIQISLVAFALVVCCLTFEHARGQERPNVLVILVDDLGYSDVGYMGGEIPTPNIDRLAGRGLRFTQCYNSARCCPSRASLMTGLYPHQTGIGSFATARPSPNKGPAYLGHLNDKCVTIAEVLGDAGYQSYMVGKWHMGEPGPIDRGFDEFYGYVNGYEQNQWDPDRYVRLPEGRDMELSYDDGDFYATDVFTDYALEFLDQARAENERPWFLYVAHSSPHFPLQAPKETVDRFVEIYRRGWDVLREERFDRMIDSGLANDTWQLSDRSMVPIDRDDIANGFPGVPNPAWDTLPEDRREDLARRMAVFAAMVAHVDEGVGRLISDLQENDELDNTLIIFLSDNGACFEWGPFGFDGPSRRGETTLHQGAELLSMGGPGSYHAYGSAWANLGNTPLRLYKHFTHEGGNCTPLLMHWPDGFGRPDRWVRHPIHIMDVLPTLSEVCDAEYPSARDAIPIQPMEGLSLAPLFVGDALPDRVIASEHNGSRSLRRGEWKVVWPMKMPWTGEWELYHIREDRCEIHDRSSEFPELTSELADEWLRWAERVKVHGFFDNPEAQSPTGEDMSPSIANRPVKVSCRITRGDDELAGVVIAHGGNQQGYALHIAEGRIHFTVRINREPIAIHAAVPESKSFTLVALLSEEGAMQLLVDGEIAATGNARSAIPVEPIDPLSIGKDIQSAVGDYASPFEFTGELQDVIINTERD